MRPASTGAPGHLPAIRALLAALVLGLAAMTTLAGCGAGTPAAPAEGSDGGSSASGGGRGATVIAPVGRSEEAAERACGMRLRGLVGAMDRLRRELAAGLSYEQYAASVREARAAYRAVPVELLPAACVLGAASAAERALNGYLGAANAWGRCLAEAGCGAATIEAQLQREWRVAANFLAAARG